MAYTSKREKIRKFIEKNVVSYLELNETELNYKMTLDLISLKTDSTKNMVKDVLNSFVSIGELMIVVDSIMLPKYYQSKREAMEDAKLKLAEGDLK